MALTNRFGITTKEELREKAETLISEYNHAIQCGNFALTIEVPKTNKTGETEMILVREAIEELVNEYTSIARGECFATLKAAEDPMIEAVKQLHYQTIRIVDKKVGEPKQKIPVSFIENAEKPIDLLKLHKYVGGDGIGRDKNWIHIAEKFNFLMTTQKAKDIGDDTKDINRRYAMSDDSRDIEFGKSPTSKNNILKTLQTVVTAMIGDEYKATLYDVNFLLSIYSRKGKKELAVVCANHKYMRQYLAEVCHHIVLGKPYSVDYKKLSYK